MYLDPQSTLQYPKLPHPVGNCCGAYFLPSWLPLTSEMPGEPSTLRELAAAPLSEDLLAYYRERVAASEVEMAQLVERIDAVSESHTTLHKARWEVHKRMDEVSDLQKALSDSHVYLWDEKERCQRMQGEIDELKLQEVEDRRKIQHLLSLVGPVVQDVTYVRDAPPETITLHPYTRATTAAVPAASHRGGCSGPRRARSSRDNGAATSGLPDSAQAPAGTTSAAAAGSQRFGCDGGGEGGDAGRPINGTRVLRTVYLPNEQAWSGYSQLS